MKKYLTKEQSKELTDLGIDPKRASLIWVKQTHNSNGEKINRDGHILLSPFETLVVGFEQFETQPIFTFGDLYDMIPRNTKQTFRIESNWDYIDVGFVEGDGHTTLERDSKKEPIDVLFEFVKHVFTF